MTDLFWPGDERAGATMSEPSFLAAMVRVEEGWLAGLVSAGIAPYAAKADLAGLVGPADVDEIAVSAEAGANPVIPLVSLLRQRAREVNDEAATWLHRGLTSQDVVDTALMLCLREALDRVEADLREQVSALSRLADEHRSTVMAGRTLTQHAVPISFGLKASGWLTGVLDAADAVDGARASLVVQVGGAAGTMAATTELARAAGLADPSAVAVATADGLAAALGLGARPPWHTSRRPVTLVGDALVAATDAWGRIASDVATLGRPEIGEVGEPSVVGRGGSSTMPTEAEPRAVRAGSARGADGTGSVRHAPHRRSAGRRRAAGRGLARRVGDAADPRPADRRRRYADHRARLRAPGQRRPNDGNRCQ